MLKKVMLSAVILGSMVIGSPVLAEDIHVTRGRQPTYEVHTHDRYIKYDHAGGRGNDGTIHFMNKTTIRRKYGDDRRRKRRQVCTDESGRRKSCP